jgi:hypothetical protein
LLRCSYCIGHVERVYGIALVAKIPVPETYASTTACRCLVPSALAQPPRIAAPSFFRAPPLLRIVGISPSPREIRFAGQKVCTPGASKPLLASERCRLGLPLLSRDWGCAYVSWSPASHLCGVFSRNNFGGFRYFSKRPATFFPQGTPKSRQSMLPPLPNDADSKRSPTLRRQLPQFAIFLLQKPLLDLPTCSSPYSRTGSGTS